MAKVVFLTQGGQEAVSTEANAGDSLDDLADRTRSPVPFSCRSASCGTCRIVVLEGAEGLDEPRDEELDVLDAFGHKPPKYRLCCQAKVGSGAAVIKLRPVRDDE